MIRWLQSLWPTGEPDKFEALADAILPKGEGGIAYLGHDLGNALGLPLLHLFVHYGSMSASPGWGSMTFGPSRWSGKDPAWRIDRRFSTRREAVVALAGSLRMLDAEIGKTQPEFRAVQALV